MNKTDAIEIKGRHTEAKIFSDEADPSSYAQILELCNRSWIGGSKIRIMPDFHVGKGCVIGTTIEIKDSVEPNLVGVDIGCGVTAYPLKDKYIEFVSVDKFIRQNVPHGPDVHRCANSGGVGSWDVNNLRAIKRINTGRTYESIGTLGGGNHYIEINRDDDGKFYLVVHSGSRNLGHQVATHYQRISDSSEGKVLSGKDFGDYIHDMKIIQEYASLNRFAILDTIVKGCSLKRDRDNEWQVNTIHNYIDTDNMILRKGAVSAKKGERLIIPLNMRDGSLFCVGKGNRDWNFSAPHGAGRVYSRSQAKAKLSMAEFKSAMQGVYTTSVSVSTIDESPMAYKDKDEIVKHISGTVDIIKQVLPVYNFKSNK